MMLNSWEACINYMTPLGLHHIMAAGHHYGPGPDVDNRGRHDWNSTYYHNASTAGVGFDRSLSGSGAVAQYHPPLSKQWNDPETCPLEFLLWFHHLPWDYPLSTGNTLWNEM